MVTHSNTASFSMKTILYQTNNILFRKNYSKLGKMNTRFWKNISNKSKVSLDVFKILLSQQLLAFKEFCIEKRLSNIFKTKNVTKLTKAILESSYRILQESICLISCIVFEEKYLSGCILLTDQMSLSDCLLLREILSNM